MGKLPLTLALSLVMASAAAGPAEAQRATLRPADRAVVRVLGVHNESTVAIGTGFFVTDGGMVATAAHVVAGARVVVGVAAATGETFRMIVRVLDESADVAILQAVGVTPPATLTIDGEVPSIMSGDAVSISGYSGGGITELAPAVTMGHISRSLSDGSMELSASVNPGQSGGPVLSAGGALLGLVSARADPASGVIGVTLVRPRDEILAAFARVGAPIDAPLDHEFARLVAYRIGAVALDAWTWEQTQAAAASAHTPHERAEVLVATAAYFATQPAPNPAVATRLRALGRRLVADFPQLLVLYPSLARVCSDA